MFRRIALAALGAAILVLAGRGQVAADEAKEHKDHMHGSFATCARACADCALACDSCFHHCAQLVAAGKKDHARTMALCNDCGELCSTSAKLTARQGPLAVASCRACARACDVCGAACGKFPKDEHMKACARACQACAKACRDMIEHAAQHAKDGKGTKGGKDDKGGKKSKDGNKE